MTKTLPDGSILEGTPEEITAYERKPEEKPARPADPKHGTLQELLRDEHGRRQAEHWRLQQVQPVTCGRPNVSRSWEATCVELGETPP